MLNINSVQNEKIKEYVKLSKNATARNESGLFTFEGVKLLQEANLCGLKIKHIFITNESMAKIIKKDAEQPTTGPCHSNNRFVQTQRMGICMENYREVLQDVINYIPSERTHKTDDIINHIPSVRTHKTYDIINHYDVYTINAAIANKLAAVKQPQGVFVVAEKFTQKLTLQNIKPSGKYLLLYDISDPGNMGTIIRGADALGIDGIICSANCCDVYNFKVIRASMGSIFRIPFLIFDDIPQFLKLTATRKIKSYAAVVDKTAKDVTECDFSSGCVLCIGNESEGLPCEVITQCTDKITVRMKRQAESLNAAAAAHIFMWEMMGEF